jgi:hypothetical protein
MKGIEIVHSHHDHVVVLHGREAFGATLNGRLPVEGLMRPVMGGGAARLGFFAAAGLRGGRYAMPAMWERVAHPGRHHAADVIERILHHLDLPTEPPHGHIFVNHNYSNGQGLCPRHTMAPAAMERHNANLVGGDITGGANMLAQVFARPAVRANNYATPVKGLYLCSASTPPGGGVHGMCGHNAAKVALRDVLQ